MWDSGWESGPAEKYLQLSQGCFCRHNSTSRKFQNKTDVNFRAGGNMCVQITADFFNCLLCAAASLDVILDLPSVRQGGGFLNLWCICLLCRVFFSFVEFVEKIAVVDRYK